MSDSRDATGEPVLAWLERHTDTARRREVEFDDPKLEYRRLFSETWGTFLLVLVAADGGVVGATSRYGRAAAARGPEPGGPVPDLPVRRLPHREDTGLRGR